MEIYSIFVICVFYGVALVKSSESSITYDYKFRPTLYINETTTPPIPQQNSSVHICQLPDEERIKICKKALEQEFCTLHEILYREDQSLGKEKTYEVNLSGLYYEGKRPPFSVSACMCPTAPPIYLRDDSYNGTDIKIYVDLHVGEDEHGFTTPWQKPTTASVNPFQ